MFRPGVWRDWRTSWYAISNWWQIWSGVESGSLCMMLTDQQSWKGIWWDWVWMATGRSGFETVVVETVSIHAVRERVVGFFNICKAFYIGETCRSLSLSLTAWMDTVSPLVLNPDLLVAIHTQSHQIPFQDCWSVSVIHKLPDSTPDHIRCQFEIAYQLVLQ